MSETLASHTPGPWVRSYHGFQVLTHDSGVSICELTPGKSRDEQIANAQLIADAPKMADELKRLSADHAALTKRVQELEAAIRTFADTMPPCSCHDAYKDRRLTDPECLACAMQPEVSELLAIAKGDDHD